MKTINQNLGWCRLSYELLADENLSAADAVVYSVLLDCCTDDFSCSRSLSEIVKLSGIPERNIYRSLIRLEEFGYIVRKRTGKESVYTLADIIGLKRERKAKPKKANPTPEQSEQGQQEIKLHYGEYQHVSLTMDQFDKLVTDFGEKKTLEYIRRCDEYCQKTGKHYSDYDLTLRSWIREDASKPEAVSEEKQKELDEYLSLVNVFDDNELASS